MNAKEKNHQIDLEEVIRNKNPRLLKLLPRVVLNYIKRVIHQTEFNSFLVETKDIHNHDFVCGTLKHFQIKVISEGLDNIPKEGGCIVVCNHPLGGIDGIAVMQEVAKRRTDIKALVNDLLMNLHNLTSLLIPINKHGKNAINNVKLLDRTYASEECIIVFPAGLVSRKQKGEIKDLEWKKSFVSKAIQYKHDVIPVYIEAKNSRFFYNLGSLRKKLGIKVNLEMFFLVDEVYKQKGKTIKISVGEPIPYTTFTKSLTHLQWAEIVKEKVYSLEKGRRYK